MELEVGNWDHDVLIEKQEAINLFNKLPKNEPEIILNFKWIINVGWFFVREYLILKEKFLSKIIEIKMDENVKKTFDIIKNLDYHCADEDFIQMFVDYKL